MMFADAHLHSNPVSGLGIKNIAHKFKNSGGWFLAIVSLPPTHYGLSSSYEGYMKSIEILINECKLAKDYGLKVACLAGLHPADIEKLIVRQVLKPKEILSLSERILKEIAYLCKKGILNGIGEVGRPHYKTKPEAIVANEIILRHALTIARDLGVIVHLHLEQGGLITVQSIKDYIELLHLNPLKILLHHLDIHTSIEAQHENLIFTIPGKYPLLREAFQRLSPNYMIESDYIDDLKRPGVSSYPWDIIHNQRRLLSEGITNEEYLYKLNIDNICRVYGVEPP